MSEDAGARIPPRKGRIGLYALWQLRDYIMDRGLPTLLVALLFGYVGVAPAMRSMSIQLERLMAARPEDLKRIPDGVKIAQIAHEQGADAARSYMMIAFSKGFLTSFIGIIVFLGALIAFSGLAANDRKNGYYRFLFSKPITAMRYYGQAFAVHSVAYVGIVALLAMLFSWLVTPIMGLALFEGIALVFLCYAGMTFAISAASRSDWLIMLAFWMFSTYAWDSYGESKAVVARLLYLLPPVHRTTEVYLAIATKTSLPWHALEWFAGYGLVCFAIGLVTLRYRRLAIL